MVVMPSMKVWPLGSGAGEAASFVHWQRRQARAITLVAGAYGALCKQIGVEWGSAANLVSLEIFKSIVSGMAGPRGLATALWIRVRLGAAPSANGGRKFVTGTVGLAAFCHPEVGYAPTSMAPSKLTAHALSTCEYLLSSGASLEDGQTIGVEGGQSFHLKLSPRGMLGADGPMMILEMR